MDLSKIVSEPVYYNKQLVDFTVPLVQWVNETVVELSLCYTYKS